MPRLIVAMLRLTVAMLGRWLYWGTNSISGQKLQSFVCAANSNLSSMRHNQILHGIHGLDDRQNDIILNNIQSQSDGSVFQRQAVVYFGGDCQDYKVNMQRHRDNKSYTDLWNLETIAETLARRFPFDDIIVVRPSKMTHGTFACFMNFVKSNEYGVPTFSDNHRAWEHLKGLLYNTYSATVSSDSNSPNDSDFLARITLVGFSKGCVVLNQLVHELPQHLKNDSLIQPFIRKVTDIYWLDGGHSGSGQTWITDYRLIQLLGVLEVRVHVHVTPYQIKDPHRPWIGQEEKKFAELAANVLNKVDEKLHLFSRVIHFQDEPRCIENHFKILSEF